MCDVLKSLPYTLLLRGPLYCLTFGFPKLSGGSQSSGRPVVETEVSLGLRPWSFLVGKVPVSLKVKLSSGRIKAREQDSNFVSQIQRSKGSSHLFPPVPANQKVFVPVSGGTTLSFMQGCAVGASAPLAPSCAALRQR